MPHILLFDSECILCNKSVQFILKHDVKKKIQFAALQSKFGQEFLQANKLPLNIYSTVIYLQENKIYTKSSAAIRVCAALNRASKIFLVFLIFPRPIRDFIYNVIAKNRKHFFKNQTSCLIPTEELKKRMLS